MTEPIVFPHNDELDKRIQQRILNRVKALNEEVLDRLEIAAVDLAEGRHRAALGALDGIERQITTMRTILLLLS
jgi:hypothetical protein